MNRDLPRISDAAWRALEMHPWPGNVRELGNVMERLVIYHAGRDVEVHDLGLPQSIRSSLYPHVAAAPSVVPPAYPTPVPPRSRPGLGGFSSDFTPLSSANIEVAPPSSASQTDVGDGIGAPHSRPRLDSDSIAAGALSLELPEGGTTFDELEREILIQVLSRAENNQSRAARSLGMSESTFRSRMKRLGLKG
jgi:sigma-54 specific flagellar transcriptional regulator A